MGVSPSFGCLDFAGEAFRALACGALWWPAADMLLVADLHLEKASWAARRGWMLPPYDSLATLERLAQAVAATGVSRVAALGDSFHDPQARARLSAPAAQLLAALEQRVEFHWIEGNHDAGTGSAALGLRGLALRHQAEPLAPGPEISGHWHPAVSIPLPGGGRVRRRCFALTPGRLVLPAYGALAGGLDVGDEALAAALGARPEALVWSRRGMVRLRPSQQRPVKPGFTPMRQASRA